MKKVFGIILAAALALPMFAETDAKADYSDWLPKQGDWNIQIGMDPLALVMGGTWSQVGGFSFGYMLTDQLGLRATCGLNLDIWNTREYAQDDAAVAENPFSKQKVTDCRKSTKVGGTFSLGVDYRVGKTKKVQGVFGAGLMYGAYFVEKYNYTYGNAITEYNQIPSTNLTQYDGTTSVWATFPAVATGVSNGRILRQYGAGTGAGTGPRQMFGLYVSAGIEWFVTPKMAIGLNANLNLMYQFMHAYTAEYEGWSQYEHKTITWTEQDKPVQDGFSFSTADAAGMKMYFSVYL